MEWTLQVQDAVAKAWKECRQDSERIPFQAAGERYHLYVTGDHTTDEHCLQDRMLHFDMTNAVYKKNAEETIF